MTWALLPLKDLVQAKSRLGGLLAPHERRALAQAMAEDVLAALTACDALDGILLISDDPGADMLAGKYGVDMVPEAGLQTSGLNGVLTAGCERLAQRGVSAVAVVHADLPLLAAAEMTQLIRAHARPGVDLVIAPDRRRDGTNVMIVNTRRRPDFRYGRASCQAHQHAARAMGLTCQIVQLPGAALDIDKPNDLIDLWRQSVGATQGVHTHAFLSRPHISRRLAALADPRASRGTRGAL